MIQFGIFVALFIAIALCFLLIPLWLKPKIVSSDDSEINIRLAQQKLQSLETDLENGVITVAQYEPLKNELMLNLHHDLRYIPTSSTSSSGRWIAIPLGVFVPLLALAIYSVKGDFRAFDDVAIKGEMPTKTAADINGMVEKLAQKMAQNPNDSEGWIMLARSYKVLKRYPEAVEALRKARALTGEQPEVLLQLADVIAMEKGGTLLGEPTELVAEALELDANNDMALWLYGLANAEDGKFNEAIGLWQKLQTHYKPEDADYLEVQKLIDQAREALGQPVPVAEKKASITNKSIHLAISLDEKFKAATNPEDFVFIYAQPAQGGKMPLAVVKKQVKDLPLDVTLDDSMAMMPNMTISSVASVQISARISHTGNAIAQSGEPIGKKQVSTSVDNGVVKLVIDERVQ
ncbi:MAG: c-type cytochrome biogenesis protein CcmI [Methylococcales bacterium]|nr:c-type cytochrome biogenesis protein CcmI [Methylococcales bacterium]MDD5754632.1 c-type cytochrome biogenesis protein CcmI [Methylococcales bacterium]